jgi:hypothetical protein
MLTSQRRAHATREPAFPGGANELDVLHHQEARGLRSRPPERERQLLLEVPSLPCGLNRTIDPLRPHAERRPQPAF